MNPWRLVTGFCAAAALAGCGSLPIDSAAFQPGREVLTGRNLTNGDLLYVANVDDSTVTVYTYPKGTYAETLSGIPSFSYGLCSDTSGHVFVTLYEAQEVLEYAHGGTQPIATLSDSGYNPMGCSVSPKTGDLAVANYAMAVVDPGDVAIYKRATGKPRKYTGAGLQNYYFCGYDGNGNLYVDGSGVKTSFQFGRLSGGVLTEIALNQKIELPGGVQWDGKYIDVGDANGGEQVYGFSMSGNQGTLERTSIFRGWRGTYQFWIDGRTIAGDEPGSTGEVGLWRYPSVRKFAPPKRTIAEKVDSPAGVTISVARSRYLSVGAREQKAAEAIGGT